MSKVVELKQLEQDPQIMNKFVQIFRRAVRKSEYERRVLVKEFKRRMNDNIRRNSIEFFCVISMQVSFSWPTLRSWDYNRNSKREEERIRGERKTVNAGGTQ